jgi:hypothetical protein
VKIEKYTFGTGDRFAHQGRAQLQAILNAREAGIDVYPVWNKSNREHSIIKSKPDDVRAEANAAVTGGYTVLFLICAFAYLVAFALNHLCAPKFDELSAPDLEK